jgi:endoglucanase
LAIDPLPRKTIDRLNRAFSDTFLPASLHQLRLTWIFGRPASHSSSNQEHTLDTTRNRNLSLARAAILTGILAGLATAADLPTAATISAQMGLGWNLGNTMETPGGAPYWSGIAPNQAQIDAVKAAGFRSVRIPCGWYSHTGSDSMTINTSWFATVKTVVDYCIKDSLYVVLNSHWDKGWLEEHIAVADSAKVRKKQSSYWTQIANYFKDYDHHLLFASANEPAVQDNNVYPVPAFGADRVAALNLYHQAMINAVRATGGNNATRTLIFQGPRADIELTKSVYNTFPKDNGTSGRLMFEDHFYPYQFTLMTADADWGNQFFYWGQGNHSATDTKHNPTWGEEAFVDSEFVILKRMFVDKGMPVIIGEVGAGLRTTLSGDNLALHKKGRLAFYKYVAKSGQAHGLIHPFVWDTDTKNDMNMTVIDRENATVYDKDLMNALVTGWGVTSLEPRSERTGTHHLAVSAMDGALQAKYETAIAGPAKVTMSDAQGRTLWSRTVQAHEGMNSIILPVSHSSIAIVRVHQQDQPEASSIVVP